MKIIFYLLLILRVGRCTDDQILETKTVGVGQNVTLTCARDTSLIRETWFWIRIVSGNSPESLGGTYNFNYDDSDKTLHITTKQEPGTFLLHIHEAKLSDVGLYSCIKVNQLNLTFLKGTFLSIGEPDITFITQDFPSAPVRPGDSVTLQCSALSHSERRTCLGEPSVFWFRAGSDESHPSLIYAQRSNSAGCEKSPEAHSPQKCVYSFSKDVTSSDVGTHYCAVATCGQILFGNGTKLDIEASDMWDLQKANAALILVLLALAISLIVIGFLIYTIKIKTCCNGNLSFLQHLAKATFSELPQLICVNEPTSFILNLFLFYKNSCRCSANKCCNSQRCPPRSAGKVYKEKMTLENVLPYFFLYI
uniref:Ig-like domain-containing protein n=1 Tax=Cyclopterus lumpus TaxID=8103 RepID=A0A8C2WQS9_CYCLU